MPSGGYRPTAGRPKGRANNRTIRQKAYAEAVLEKMREVVAKHMPVMFEAQMAHAQGVHYMMLRESDGGYAKLSDDPEISDKQIRAAIASGGQAFKIFKQAPNTQAFNAVLDQVLGKPLERHEVTGQDGAPLTVVIKKPWADGD